MWDLIVSVPDHCLSFYFELQRRRRLLWTLRRLNEIIQSCSYSGKNVLSKVENFQDGGFAVGQEKFNKKVNKLRAA